jgi:hypothetical protein
VKEKSDECLGDLAHIDNNAARGILTDGNPVIIAFKDDHDIVDVEKGEVELKLEDYEDYDPDLNLLVLLLDTAAVRAREIFVSRGRARISQKC